MSLRAALYTLTAAQRALVIGGGLFLILILGYFAFGSFGDWWSSWRYEKKVTELEQKVSEADAKAIEAETKARLLEERKNQLEGKVAELEARVDVAESDLAAARSSSGTARKGYKAVHSGGVAAVPSTVDEKSLCSQLAALGLPCR